MKPVGWTVWIETRHPKTVATYKVISTRASSAVRLAMVEHRKNKGRHRRRGLTEGKLYIQVERTHMKELNEWESKQGKILRQANQRRS